LDGAKDKMSDREESDQEFSLDEEISEKKKRKRDAEEVLLPDAPSKKGPVTIASSTDPADGPLYAKTLNLKDLAIVLRGLCSIPGCDFIHMRFSADGLQFYCVNGAGGSMMAIAFLNKSMFQANFRCTQTVECWISRLNLEELLQKLAKWEMIEFTLRPGGGFMCCGVLRFDVGSTGLGHWALIAIEEQAEPMSRKFVYGWHIVISANKLKISVSSMKCKAVEMMSLKLNHNRLIFAGATDTGDIVGDTVCEIDSAPANQAVSVDFCFPFKLISVISNTFGKVPNANVQMSFNVDPTPGQADVVQFSYMFDNAQPQSHLSIWVSTMEINP
jgi:hypothetical protein